MHVKKTLLEYSAFRGVLKRYIYFATFQNHKDFLLEHD